MLGQRRREEIVVHKFEEAHGVRQFTKVYDLAHTM